MKLFTIITAALRVKARRQLLMLRSCPSAEVHVCHCNSLGGAT